MSKSKTKPVPFALGELQLRYRPLPGLATADYFDEYTTYLESVGAFEELRLSSIGIDLTAFDASAIGAWGSTIARVLTGGESGNGKRLRDHIIDHCKLFNVQIKDGDEWASLTTAEDVDEHLEFVHLAELMWILVGSVLSPLAGRLKSIGAEKAAERARHFSENEASTSPASTASPTSDSGS